MFYLGNASKNAGKRLLELQSHDLCDWLVELRDMILVPVVVLVILSLVIILVCVLRGRRKQFDGSMATMSESSVRLKLCSILCSIKVLIINLQFLIPFL